MNNHKQIKNHVIRWMLYVLALGVALSFVRIPFGSVSLSVITILSFVIGLFFTHDLLKNTTDVLPRHKKILCAVGLLFILLFLSATQEDATRAYGIFLEWLALPILTSFVFVSVIRREIYTKHALTGALALYIASIVIVSTLYLIYDGFTYDGRLSGPWGSPNILAMLLGPALLVFAYFLHNTSRKLGILYKSIFILGAAVFFATQSIFGIGSTVIAGTAIYTVLHYYQKRSFFRPQRVGVRLLGVFVLCVALFVVFFVRGSTFTQDIDRSSLTSRVMIWSVAVELIAEEPLRGYPLSSFQEKYLSQQEHYTPYLEWAVPTPHNIYLTLWFYGGFFALFALSYIIIFSFIRSINIFVKTKEKAPLIFGGALLAIALHGFFDTPIFGIGTSYIFWILVVGIVSFGDPDDAKFL